MPVLDDDALVHALMPQLSSLGTEVSTRSFRFYQIFMQQQGALGIRVTTAIQKTKDYLIEEQEKLEKRLTKKAKAAQQKEDSDSDSEEEEPEPKKPKPEPPKAGIDRHKLDSFKFGGTSKEPIELEDSDDDDGDGGGGGDESSEDDDDDDGEDTRPSYTGKRLAEGEEVESETEDPPEDLQEQIETGGKRGSKGGFKPAPDPDHSPLACVWNKSVQAFVPADEGDNFKKPPEFDPMMSAFKQMKEIMVASCDAQAIRGVTFRPAWLPDATRFGDHREARIDPKSKKRGRAEIKINLAQHLGCLDGPDSTDWEELNNTFSHELAHEDSPCHDTTHEEAMCNHTKCSLNYVRTRNKKFCVRRPA